jgi:hypothetical protein
MFWIYGFRIVGSAALSRPERAYTVDQERVDSTSR